MKLYQSYVSPNSRRVRIFLAEKGLEIPCDEVDILKGQSHTLFGTTAKETAVIEMWQRRIELKWFVPLTEYWMRSAPMWAQRVKQIPELAEQNSEAINQFLVWLDGDMAGREYIAGDHYSIADIIALTTMDHADSVHVGLKVSQELKNLARWHDTVSNRPSAQA